MYKQNKERVVQNFIKHLEFVLIIYVYTMCKCLFDI